MRHDGECYSVALIVTVNAQGMAGPGIIMI